MYTRDVMGEKRKKVSFFSVVTEISTYGDTLKHRVWTFLSHYLDSKHHVDLDYKTQIAKNDVNKGHISDFQKISNKKIEIFLTKKFVKIFSMILRLIYE